MSLDFNEIKNYADFFNRRIIEHFNEIEPEILKKFLIAYPR
jgi:hypothetical protein